VQRITTATRTVFVSIGQLRRKTHRRQTVRRPNAEMGVIRTVNIGRERVHITEGWQSGFDKS
jgi:hypothetical protein